MVLLRYLACTGCPKLCDLASRRRGNTMLLSVARRLRGSAARPIGELGCPHAAWRGLAKKAAGGPVAGQKGDSAAGSADLESVTTGLNILKGGSDPPIQPDSEYPEWVFELHLPPASLDDLQRRYEKDPDSLRPEEMRKMVRMWNRARIKANNESKQ